MAEEQQSLLQPARPIPVGTPEIRKFAEAEQKRQIQAAQPEVSFSEFVGLSTEEDWMLSYLFDGKEEYAPDEDYSLTEEQYTELTADMPEDYHDYLEETVSLEHARAMRTKVLDSIEREKKMATWGWKGTALRMGVAVLDPAAIGISVATEGVAAPLIFGQKISRIGRIARGAVGAAATNAAVEGYIASQSVTRDEYDVLFAATAGLILGGGVGALTRATGNEKEVTEAIENIASAVENAQSQEIAQGARQAAGLPDSSVGAAEDPLSPSPLITNTRSATADVEDLGEMQKSEWSGLRIDIANYLLNSTNPYFNFFGRALTEDAVGVRKGKVIESTADILKTNDMKGKFSQFYQTYITEYKAWSKENKLGFFARSKLNNRRAFGEAVADAIENPDGIHSPAVKRMAQRNAKLYQMLLREAKEAGVEGFESIPENLTYFSHRWSKYKFADAYTQFGGERPVLAVLKQGLIQGSPDLSEEAAEIIAFNMNRKIKEDLAGLDSGFSRLFTADSRDTLKQIMIDERFGKQVDGEFKEFTEEEVDRLIGLFEQKQTGKPSMTKTRLKFDMNATVDVGDRTISLKQLQERDAEQVFTMYANELTGRIALAKKGIKSDRDFENMISRGKDYAQNEGLPDTIARNVRRIGKEEEIARTVYNMLIGRRPPNSPDPNSGYMKSLRILQDYNFIRLMNQVGFAQFAELGNAVQVGGIRGMLQAMPEYRKMLKRARNGELEDAVMRDIEAYYGNGSDRMINQHINRLDYMENNSPYSGGLLDRVQRGTDQAKRITADISGMAPITLGLERGTARIVAQTITDLAYKNASLSKKRLMSLGLDEETSQLVFDNIKAHARVTDSYLFGNKKLREINLDDWDPAARDAFGVALSRWTRKAIQQNDIGNLSLFMTKPMGQMLVQFRTFQIVSHAKQFLSNVSMRDGRAGMAVLASSFTATLAYMAQMNLQASTMGDKERKEFVEERLSISAVSKAAFLRSSWAAFLPPTYDLAATFYSTDPTFSYRASGLSNNPITGNPTSQLVFGAFESLQGASRALLNPDVQMTKGRARAGLSLLPYANALGVQNFFRAITEDLPTTSRVD